MGEKQQLTSSLQGEVDKQRFVVMRLAAAELSGGQEGSCDLRTTPRTVTTETEAGPEGARPALCLRACNVPSFKDRV